MMIQNWRDFARVTIETNDLDPSYVFLYNLRKDKGEDWSTRFVIHYLCFYDLGGAVKAANETSQSTFWGYVVAHYDEFTRGTERRHSRGNRGLPYIHQLIRKGSPLQIWPRMHAPTYTGLVKLFNTEFAGCGFGPYFIWKVLDFQERVWGRPITLSIHEAVKYCPDDPRKCAAAMWPDMPFTGVLQMVEGYISQFPAPPNADRACSYQEAETVLCMLKGYFLTQKHTIGDDVDSKYIQLARFPDLLKHLPPKQDWSQYVRGPLVP